MRDMQQAVLMTEVARSDRLWTRAAVRGGRFFVCFPRWFADEHVRVSVGELVSPRRVKPYPDEAWNSWKRGDPPGDKFVCVQSVYFDDERTLWVLDAANPTDLGSGKHGGVIEDGPKLYKFDVGTGRCGRTYSFSKSSYQSKSYFNDVRICTERQKAFITDSGVGAIIVLDLRTGDSRRLLEEHKSVQAEKDFVLKITGEELGALKVHSDGIALSPDRKYLYYQALTGETLYRIKTEYLLQDLAPAHLSGKVEEIGKTGAADGIQFGADGHLYLTGIAQNAIKRIVVPYSHEKEEQSAKYDIVAYGEELEWPDSIARAADGSLYVTTARINDQLPDRRKPPRGPFKLFRLQVGKLGYF